MNKYIELEKLCNTFDKGFNAVKGFVETWSHDKKSIKKTMGTILTSGMASKIVTDLSAANAYLYMFAEFFQDPKAIKQLKTKYQAELSPVGYQVLSFWQDTPAFWCYFSVKEELDDDFWTIVDNLSGEELLLHSKGITTMQKWKDSEGMRYLCLMLPNEQCVQTVGVIKYNKIPVADFLYYCSLFQPEEGLKAILSKHFLHFWQIDLVATRSIANQNGYELGYTWQPFSLPNFDKAKLGGKWGTWKHDGKEKYFIEKPDPFMDKLPSRRLLETSPIAMGGSIVRNPKTGEMGLATSSEIAYPFYAAILNRAYPELKLPNKPSISVSVALRELSTITELPFPWRKFREILEYKEEVKKSEYDFLAKDIRNLYSELEAIYMKASLSGEPLDIDAISKAAKIDRKTAERFFPDFYDEIENTPFAAHSDDDEDSEERAEYGVFNLPAKEKAFQLTGWEMPEESDGGYLFDGLYDSELFVIKDEEEAYRQLVQLTNEAYAQELDRYGVCTNIEALFEETFDEDLVYPLMNTFFWLLYHKGREWTPVRSYAIELVKWIPTAILREYVEYEDFIEEFSRFTKRLLCTRGVCSLDKRPTADEVKDGTYAIKGTGAFYSLLKIREEDD